MNKVLIAAASLQLLASQCEEPPVTPTVFTLTLENISPSFDLSETGIFNTPVGQSDPGPLLPGSRYVLRFAAPVGAHLSFASMFVQSNDLFIAPQDNGLPLFHADGTPRSGDVTDEIDLWDVGTERNEAPGEGHYQPLSQPEANSGPADPNAEIRLVDDGHTYPDTRDMLRVILVHDGDNMFSLEIINTAAEGTLVGSDGMDIPVVFAPGIFTVHSADHRALFTNQEADRGEGLEALAEDGGVDQIASTLMPRTGLNVPLSPGLLTTHEAGYEPYFTYWEADRGAGLENLAEGGDPTVLAEGLEDDAFIWEIIPFNTPIGADGPAPIFSGDSYSITFEAAPGEAVSLATMFIPSNDGFYTLAPEGLELFDAHGDPIDGDITRAFGLWDAGTEINQAPGTGVDQPLNGGGASGEADPNESIRLLDDGFTYPALHEVMKVSLHIH